MATIPSPFATTPGGNAGGDLSGTYPNPTVAGSSAATFAVANKSTFGDMQTITSTDNAGSLNINQNVATTTNPGTISQTETAATAGSYAVKVSGDTNTRFNWRADGQMKWGPGNATQDTFLLRAANGVLGTTKNLLVGASSALGDNGVGEIQLANATTVPTTNPSGGSVVYATSGTPWHRDNNGNVNSLLAAETFNAFPAGALAESVPRWAMNSQAVAIGATTGTVYMVAVWLPAGTLLTHVNFVTGSTAANTPTHWWAGYADSGGVQRAHTADQLTGAVAANTAFSIALAANYTTTATGVYYFLLSMTATANATLTGVSAVTNSSKVTPVLAGVSASAAQSTPGTDGATTYSVPTGDNAIGYFYAT